MRKRCCRAYWRISSAPGVIDGHRLLAHHSVVMDPAYVHITERSNAERDRLRVALAGHGVHSIGRYGGWTYCSIEDNIVEARALVETFKSAIGTCRKTHPSR